MADAEKAKAAEKEAAAADVDPEVEPLPSEKLAQEDAAALAERLNEEVANRPEDHELVVAEEARSEADEALAAQTEEEAAAKEDES